jgi:hypothetical protein
MEKKNTLWKVLTAILAIGAVCAAAAVVYHKFFRKKKEALVEEEELPLLDGEEIAEETFEVSADAVIANVEDMEEVPAEEAPVEEAPVEEAPVVEA